MNKYTKIFEYGCTDSAVELAIYAANHFITEKIVLDYPKHIKGIHERTKETPAFSESFKPFFESALKNNLPEFFANLEANRRLNKKGFIRKLFSKFIELFNNRRKA